MSPSPLPISKLAQFAADPASFGRPSDHGERAAMRYGVDWHDRLGGSAATRPRGCAIFVFIVIALVVLLLLSAA